MKEKLIFLLEEPSMEAFLDEFLPKILPADIEFQTISHNGKSDLKNSIPRKLRGWSGNVKFVVLCDKDSNDCINLKKELLDLCNEGRRPDTLVRIVCTELESWFLGDLEAVGNAFENGKLKRLQNKEKFREPDHLANPKQELKRLVKKTYQQISGARNIAQYMNPESENLSYSFKVFVSGIKKITEGIAIN